MDIIYYTVYKSRFLQRQSQQFKTDASVGKTDTNGATPIHNRHPDSPPIPVFIFCIPPLRVIQKTETPKWRKRLARSLSLSLSPTPLPLSFLPKGFTPAPPFCAPHADTPLLHPPSLGSPALGCQMYYRVKRSNVNTESCHGCRVVRPSPSPPSLSLWPRGGGVQRKRARGGGERSSWSVICVLAGTAVFLQSAVSVNASDVWVGMLRSCTWAHSFLWVIWEWFSKLVVKSETFKMCLM